MLSPVVLTMWLAVGSHQEPAVEPRQLTLREALALAFDRNLALARAQSDVPLADASRRLTRSFVLPHLSVNGSLVRNSAEVSFGPPDDVRTILPLVNWDIRVALSQPIFAGLRDLKAYRQSKIDVDFAQEGTRLVSNDVLLTTSAQFLLALEAEALIEVERQNVEIAQARRQVANDLFQAGETTRLDVLRADADIKAAERRLVEAQRGRAVAMSALRRALALDEDLALVEPAGDNRAVPLLPPEDELVSQALGARPDVRRAQYQIETAELEVQKQKGAYFPVVSFDAGFVRQKTTFPSDTYGFGALRVNVPIYQGGEVSAQVAIAEQELKQATLALDEVERNVREDIRIALFDVEASRTNLELAEEQLVAAEAEFDQTSELYLNQELTSLDVQAAQATLSDARRAVATGRLLVYAAEIGVWYAAGTLTEVALNQGTTP